MPPVSLGLLAANLVVFLLLQGASGDELLALFALWPPGMPGGPGFQPWQLLTYGFMHVQTLHLFFNMFSLYFFGSSIETIFSGIFGRAGNVYYVALYLLAIVVSDLPSYFKHRKQPRYNSLGASGGVAAVIFAFIVFAPLESICIYVALCMPGIIFGVLYVAYSYYQGKRSGSNINHDAHLYGAVFGILFCAVVYPSSIVLCYEQVAQWFSNR